MSNVLGPLDDSRLPARVERQVNGEVALARTSGSALAARESAKVEAIAEITQTALLEASQLSALEGILLARTPHAGARLRHIADAVSLVSPTWSFAQEGQRNALEHLPERDRPARADHGPSGLPAHGHPGPVARHRRARADRRRGLLGRRHRRGGALAASVLLVAGFGALSIAFGLLVRREESVVGAVQLIVLPASLLSATFMQLSLAPGWIGDIARFNPVNWAVEAGREALGADVDWSLVGSRRGYLAAFGLVCAWLATRATSAYQRSI